MYTVVSGFLVPIACCIHSLDFSIRTGMCSSSVLLTLAYYSILAMSERTAGDDLFLISPPPTCGTVQMELLVVLLVQPLPLPHLLQWPPTSPAHLPLMVRHWYSCFRVFSPTLHTAIAQVITVLEWWSLTNTPVIGIHVKLRLPILNYMSDCSVQCICAIRTISSATIVCTGVHNTHSWYFNLTFALSKYVCKQSHDSYITALLITSRIILSLGLHKIFRFVISHAELYLGMRSERGGRGEDGKGEVCPL